MRHGIQPGMIVLDTGPGNGTYTVAAARQAGPEGKVYAMLFGKEGSAENE